MIIFTSIYDGQDTGVIFFNPYMMRVQIAFLSFTAILVTSILWISKNALGYIAKNELEFREFQQRLLMLEQYELNQRHQFEQRISQLQRNNSGLQQHINSLLLEKHSVDLQMMMQV